MISSPSLDFNIPSQGFKAEDNGSILPLLPIAPKHKQIEKYISTSTGQKYKPKRKRGPPAKNTKQNLIRVQYEYIDRYPNTRISYESAPIYIFADVSLSYDGILRTCSAISPISFGYHQMQPDRIEDLTSHNVLNIRNLFKGSLYEDHKQVESCLEILSRFPHTSNYPQIAQTIYLLERKLQRMQRAIQNAKTHAVFDDFFDNFQSACFEYLQNSLSPNSLFTYQIGRINLFDSSVEFTHSGYSKPYLNILGIDSTAMTTMILRKKRIDLFRYVADITKQSVKWLEYTLNHSELFEFETEIVTFDGFPLKLRQSRRSLAHLIKLPSHNNNPPNSLLFERMFNVTIMEVDVEELKQLLKYREEIASSYQSTCGNTSNNSSNSSLSLDNFIKKEISLLFEDVEYSVHSSLFVDRFYNSNINSLTEIINAKNVSFNDLHNNQTTRQPVVTHRPFKEGDIPVKVVATNYF